MQQVAQTGIRSGKKQPFVSTKLLLCQAIKKIKN